MAINIRSLIAQSVAKRAYSLLKKENSAATNFLHDYSILPNSIQYRLPNKGEETVPNKFNIPQFIFEHGGIKCFDVNENAKYFKAYPLLNSRKLSTRRQRPRSVKMLSGDFIEDSLYNPHYGYFSREAIIFNPAKGFDYAQLKGYDDFMDKWLEQYDKYDQKALAVRENTKLVGGVANSPAVSQKSVISQNIDKPSMQLWHTPTELFQPFYGEALARYILVNYKLNQYSLNDLIIYEVGGGNGTLMLNILNFIEQNDPEVYKKTKYKIIEISGNLAQKQKENSLKMKLKEAHKHKIELINKSIFDWTETVYDPCFVICLEVFDNFAHDVVRYHVETKQPYQGYVVIDENGDFKEFFSPDIDPWTKSFIGLREETNKSVFKKSRLFGKHPTNGSKLYKSIIDSMIPMRNGLGTPEYVPTRLLKFFQILKNKFPQHQLLASDFSKLPDRSLGYNSPVVQTMFKNRMITADTYMVNQGYFDIMFPTDFELASELYRKVVGKVSEHVTHADFLKVWADVEKTKTQSGENPMLELYDNASFLYS